MLTPELTVNDVILRYPEAIRVLNELQIDTCCGGARSLREAAAEAGLDVERLLEELRRVVEA